MKKYFLSLLCVLLAAMALGGCGSVQPAVNIAADESGSDKLTAAALLDSVNESHRLFTETAADAADTAYTGDLSVSAVDICDGVPLCSDLSEDEINSLLSGARMKQTITADEALDDLDLLMRLLETSYAGYEYFGGRERFDKARESIIRDVTEAYGENQGEGSVMLFLDILRKELAFVEDSHFRFDRQTDFREQYLYYEDARLVFGKDADGYYTVINGQRWYAPDIDEQYFMPTMDGGALSYGMFGLAYDDGDLPPGFLLHNGDKVTELAANWKPAKAGDGHNKAHELYEQDGVKVLRIGAFSDNSSDRLAEYAMELRGEDVFIIDLRGNTGGIVMIPDIFLRGLTGTIGRFPLQTVKKYGALNKRLLSDSAALIRGRGSSALKNSLIGEDSYIEEFSEFALSGEQIDAIPAGEIRSTAFGGRWNEYPGHIIVLCDKQTCSASELFLLKLMTFENVIILGTNSNGCLVDGDVNMQSISLPSTGIPLTFGQTMLYTSLTDGFDSRGVIPDVACRGDAMADAVALARAIRETGSEEE